MSDLQSRLKFIEDEIRGKSTPPARDLYDREPIATRVVQLMPRECWQTAPLMYDPN